jgi:CheY-like chemotaxis protein
VNATAVNILLVDDDAVDVMSVERAFKSNHIKNPLITAVNGLEALELLRGTRDKPAMEQPLLVLLDINMPVMNGLEFLRVIRTDAKLKHIPVVVLTTSDEEKDIINAYDLNVAGYIIKPVEPTAFKEAIRIIDSYWMLCRIPE